MAVRVKLTAGTFEVNEGRWQVVQGGPLALALLDDLDRTGRTRYPQGRGTDLPHFDRLLADAVVARFGGNVLRDPGVPRARKGVVY